MSREVYYRKELSHKNPNYTVIFTAEEEDIEVEGQFDNPSDVKNINRRLNNGDMAAFFSAKVEVRLKGTDLSGADYLGCCSYKSFENFIDSKDYFDDMVENATTELEKRIKETKDILNSL